MISLDFHFITNPPHFTYIVLLRLVQPLSNHPVVLNGPKPEHPQQNPFSKASSSVAIEVDILQVYDSDSFSYNIYHIPPLNKKTCVQYTWPILGHLFEMPFEKTTTACVSLSQKKTSTNMWLTYHFQLQAKALICWQPSKQQLNRISPWSTTPTDQRERVNGTEGSIGWGSSGPGSKEIASKLRGTTKKTRLKY